jgi:hypothetical protein
MIVTTPNANTNAPPHRIDTAWSCFSTGKLKPTISKPTPNTNVVATPPYFEGLSVLQGENNFSDSSQAKRKLHYIPGFVGDFFDWLGHAKLYHFWPEITIRIEPTLGFTNRIESTSDLTNR